MRRRSHFVGYAQTELKNGNTLAGVQFVTIGDASATPLQSIIPVGDNVSDNVVLQTLDFAGRTVDSYMWIDWAGSEGDQEAWVNDETYEIIEGVSFAPGAGLCIQGTTTSQSIQSSGLVGTSDVSVTLRMGNTIVCNPFPVSVDLQDILPTGDNVSDNVVLQTLDFAGRTVDSYMWINWAGSEGDQEAWVNDETYEIIEGVSFPGGTGLCVQGTSTAQAIRFPAPEL